MVYNIVYSLEKFYLRHLRLCHAIQPLGKVIFFASKIPSNIDTLDQQSMIYFYSLDEQILSKKSLVNICYCKILFYSILTTFIFLMLRWF